MGSVNNLLPNYPQNQAPQPQQGQNQNQQQPPNVAIILNPDEKVPLPQGRQVWGFDNTHGVQTLSSDPPRVRTPLPPFLNPTPRPFLQPNIRVHFLTSIHPISICLLLFKIKNQNLPTPLLKINNQQFFLFLPLLKIKDQRFFLPLFSTQM